jgi:hypothetical protein
VPPTPASITAGVREGGRLQAIDAALGALFQRREAVLAATGDMMTQRNAEPDGLRHELQSYTNREIQRLAAELRRIDVEITALRREDLPLRIERGARVAEALSPMTTGAAGQVLAALAQLREAATLIAACADQVERAGGEPLRVRLPDHLDAVEAMARRLASAVAP